MEILNDVLSVWLRANALALTVGGLWCLGMLVTGRRDRLASAGVAVLCFGLGVYTLVASISVASAGSSLNLAGKALVTVLAFAMPLACLHAYRFVRGPKRSASHA